MASIWKENTIECLKVLRTSEQGAFLWGGTESTSDDILLHKDQQTEAVSIGDEVEVFLYRDPKGRLTASMHLPKLVEGQLGYVPVVNVTNFGAFVDLGTERGIFMPHAEMRGRPQIGEKVWVRLYKDKSGRLAVSMDVDDAMRRASLPAKGAVKGAEIRGAIYNITADGAFFITAERWIAFIHRKEWVGSLTVGQMVKGRITYIREDGRLNASMRPLKEKALETDGVCIMAYLQSRSGRMPYSDETEASLIGDRFGISKAAFKRAIGHLMKEGLLYQKEGWSYLTEKGESWRPTKKES